MNFLELLFELIYLILDVLSPMVGFHRCAYLILVLSALLRRSLALLAAFEVVDDHRDELLVVVETGEVLDDIEFRVQGDVLLEHLYAAIKRFIFRQHIIDFPQLLILLLLAFAPHLLGVPNIQGLYVATDMRIAVFRYAHGFIVVVPHFGADYLAEFDYYAFYGVYGAVLGFQAFAVGDL